MAAIRPHPQPHACPVCGVPLPRFIGRCERCRREEFAFDRAVALHRYDGPAADVVRAYKFARHPSLARVIAAALAPVVRRLASAGACIVPAPSRPATVRRRGFAGAVLVARELGRRCGIEVADVLQMGGRDSQKGLGYEERARNTLDAITIRPGVRRRGSFPREVIIVDDVLTTGHTADACARVLRAGGSEHVAVVTFAAEY